MKQVIALVVSALVCPVIGYAQAPDTLLAVRQTVGSTKITRLSLHANGGLYLGGEYDEGLSAAGLPAAGAGTRLIWYPGKAAFRAGSVNGTQWNDPNIGLYSVALGQNARASGDDAFALGKNTVAGGSTTLALGQYCQAIGAASVALGTCAHTNSRQGSFVFADRTVVDDGNSDTDEYFKAPVNHSANWRTMGGFRVVTGGTLVDTDGDGLPDYVPTRGVSILPVTTTNPSNVGNTNWGQTAALIATSAGAYLSEGGAWVNASDRNRKHRFEPVAGEDVLAKLRQVPITRWSYKTDNPQVRHLGPMAQDFRRAFGLGHDSISIGTVDADGVALAGVQALDARTQAQAAQLVALQTQLQALQADNLALRARLDQNPGGDGQSGLSATVMAITAALVAGSALLWRRSVV